MEEQTGKPAGTPAREKPPVFLIVLAVVCLSGVVMWALTAVLRLVLTAIGVPMPECGETNFWLGSFYALVLGTSGLAVLPGLISIGFGTFLLIVKKPWGVAAICLGLVSAPVNMKLTYDTWVWYDSSSKEVLREEAKDSLKSLARAQKQFLRQHNTYAAASAELKEDFTFGTRGTVEVTGATATCYQARATHECLMDPVLWDSCKSGLQ